MLFSQLCSCVSPSSPLLQLSFIFMSSSSPPLVPSLASCEFRSSPSSPPINGSSAAARVSHCLRKASDGAEDKQHKNDGRLRTEVSGTGEPTYSTQIEDGRGDPSHIAGPKCMQTGRSSRKSAGDRIPPCSTSASAPSLNPLAREFVPGLPISPPNSDGFMDAVEPAELASAIESSSPDKSLPLEYGSKGVSGIIQEGTDEERLRPSQQNDMQRSGGLSTAFKRGGQMGQSRIWTVSKGGSDGSSALPATGKRGQFTSANHLLNFQYDPIVRPPPAPRSSYARKSHKVQPFNKELFLQANFRFLVSDFGDYLLNSLDPDRMLQWEDIAAVNISAPVPTQCPICLETPPVCPQITSCGHIFCFPCILRYLVLGDEEQRNDHFKKCPLCFAMTSSRALRTVFIDTVPNYQVGDTIELTLLNRAKGSIIPFEKSDNVGGSLPYSKDGQCHSFSKFTLTSDADHTTNKAITELSSWAERAQNLGGEDMDSIPFALLAIDQLQQRKSAWNDHRASEFLSSSPPVRQRIMAQIKESSLNSPSQGLKSSDPENDNMEGTKRVSQEKQRGEKVDIAAETDAAMKDLKDKSGWVYENAFSDDDGVELSKTRRNKVKYVAVEQAQSATPEDIPASWEEAAHEKANGLETVEDKDMHQAVKREDDDNESYTFFQCADGQPLIMHPLNMKCLLQHWGSYEKLPSRLQVRILELEGQIQTDALRKRYRYLSHLPLTTNFWFCEVDLRGVLPSSAFTPFIDELRYRETRRRRRQKQEQAARLREERISAVQSRNSPPAEFFPFIEDNGEEKQQINLVSDESSLEPVLSMPSTGPADQRKLFSQVTRLGFASAHDAPDLMPGKVAESSQEKASSSTGASAGKSPSMSFADIIQAQPSKAIPPVRNGTDGSSKSSSRKNKKASKILLSTAGGRRY